MEKQISNGALFKRKFGFSKTMKRNLAKHSERNEFGAINYISVEEYRKLRKGKKKEQRKLWRSKHISKAAERAGKTRKPHAKQKNQK